MKKESSAVGGVAGYDGIIGSPATDDKMDTTQRKKIKRDLTMKGKQKNQPKEFTYAEGSMVRRKSPTLESIAQDVKVDLMFEGDEMDALQAVNAQIDSLSDQIKMSIHYAKSFANDGLKLGSDEAVGYNIKRSMAEIRRIQKLAGQMGELFSKVTEAKAHKDQRDGEVKAQEDMQKQAVKAKEETMKLGGMR